MGGFLTVGLKKWSFSHQEALICFFTSRVMLKTLSTLRKLKYLPHLRETNTAAIVTIAAGLIEPTGRD